ncbi:MAG: hypothetical protein IJH32_05470 [Ruminococcus sp.]|nr:hypothetical protein [Ruminococcus sp.]MBQ6336828.1 hypothetical protein [Ruminococcus sp.]
MKALSIQEYIDLRDESRERFGVTLHLHDHCTSQYLSSDGQPFDSRYSAYLLNYFDSKKLSATISNDRTGVLILPKGL